MMRAILSFYFFFFNDTATTEIYTLSLHDALPICGVRGGRLRGPRRGRAAAHGVPDGGEVAWRGDLHRRGHLPAHPMEDRKSTRLNSSHPSISYAVFCLKKKKKKKQETRSTNKARV